MSALQSTFRALLATALLASPSQAQDAPAPVADEAVSPELVWMGTGSVTGVYFPAGVAICRLTNQHRQETGVRCSAKPTAGSLENIAGLRDGRLELAIVQTDALAQAVSGTGVFADAGPDDGLRSVMSLYPEALTLVVRADAGVSRAEDLAGKRIVLGQEGSGTRALTDAFVGALGWTPDSFAATPDVPPEALGQALCDGEIDGFFYTVGHPARVIQEATRSCDARLVPVEGAAVDALVDSEPYYVAATIPGGLYRGNAGPVATFGVGAVLATAAAVPDETVGLVVRSAADDLDMLTGLDPVFGGLTPETLISERLAAPLHPAAQAVYREKGWQ